jgi:hypothetical protein
VPVAPKPAPAKPAAPAPAPQDQERVRRVAQRARLDTLLLGRVLAITDRVHGRIETVDPVTLVATVGAASGAASFRVPLDKVDVDALATLLDEPADRAFFASCLLDRGATALAIALAEKAGDPGKRLLACIPRRR